MVTYALALIVLLAGPKAPPPGAEVGNSPLALEFRGETVWCHGVGVLEVALKNLSKMPIRIIDPFSRTSDEPRWEDFSVFFSRTGTHDTSGGGQVQSGSVHSFSSSKTLTVAAGGALTGFIVIDTAPVGEGRVELEVTLTLHRSRRSDLQPGIELQHRGSVRLTPDRKGCFVAKAL